MRDKIDILYIHPTKTLKCSAYSIIPVGVFGLANQLIKEGYEFRGINIGIENFLNNRYDLKSELLNIEYKALIIDLHWYEHSYGAMEIARISKEIYPSVPVIIGGFTATIYADEIIKEFSQIDYIIMGDSELPLINLIEYVSDNKIDLKHIPNLAYRKNGGLFNNKITYHNSNINEIDYISYKFLKNKKYTHYTMESGLKLGIKMASLLVAKGCRFNCSYCGGSKKNSEVLFGRSNMMFRSSEAIVKDIQRMNEIGVQAVFPTHDFYMLEPDYYKEIFSQMREMNINIGLNAHCCQLPSIEYMNDIVNTFNLDYTQISIAPYTGDEDVRIRNGKKFTNKEFYELLDYMQNNKIRLHLFYAFNVNNERMDSFEKTLAQIEDIALRYPSELLSISCGRMILDPLAPIREEMINNESMLKSFMDYYNYCKENDDSNVGYYNDSVASINNKIEQYSRVKSRIDEYNAAGNRIIRLT